MEIKFLKQDKNQVEVQFDNLTVAEILRVYLDQDSDVEFVAWKREHMTENPIMKIKTKSKDVGVVVQEAVTKVTADLDKMLADFKTLK